LVDVDGPRVEVHFPDDKPGDWLFPDQNHNSLVSSEQGKTVANSNYYISVF